MRVNVPLTITASGSDGGERAEHGYYDGEITEPETHVAAGDRVWRS